VLNVISSNSEKSAIAEELPKVTDSASVEVVSEANVHSQNSFPTDEQPKPVIVRVSGDGLASGERVSVASSVPVPFNPDQRVTLG
jgi:hypothetical protein